MAYTKIESINALKTLAADRTVDCFIALNGNCRSSKDIHYDTECEVFTVYNCIDGSEQVLTEAELGTESNILEAVTKGALYKH